jgi:5'-deoxynucleotidase YfbR-like HD superfamily hydrolase
LDKELLRTRLAFIREGSEVERYHTKRMLQRNDVGHHSFHVAWLAWLMAEGRTGETLALFGWVDIIMAALSHDLAEHVTGDMPSDFKREMGIGEQFNRYEIELFKDVQLSNFAANLYEPGKRIVKLADMMEGAFFCISEASLGNGRVGIVFRNYRRYIEKLAPFNETEAEILEFIDELWANYGVDTAPGWSKTAHRKDGEMSLWNCPEHGLYGGGPGCPLCGVVGAWQSGEGLVSELRAEEAEGRATPGPQSKAPVQGDTGVPERPADEPVDDRATSDIAVERPSSPANARQHGGDHYKGVGYEHWDLVLDTGMNYFQGCATKYVTRWRKHEAGETNLLKAIHYVDKLTEAQAAGRIKPEGIYSVNDIISFGVANSLNEVEVQVIKDIVGWRLDAAREHLERLRAGYTELERTNERAYYSQND